MLHLIPLGKQLYHHTEGNARLLTDMWLMRQNVNTDWLALVHQLPVCEQMDTSSAQSYREKAVAA